MIRGTGTPPHSPTLGWNHRDTTGWPWRAAEGREGVRGSQGEAAYGRTAPYVRLEAAATPSAALGSRGIENVEERHTPARQSAFPGRLHRGWTQSSVLIS